MRSIATLDLQYAHRFMVSREKPSICMAIPAS